MLPYRDSKLARIILGVFFILVLVYAYYEARGLLYGPSIQVLSGVTVTNDPFITIRGTAERIAELSMNGKAIPVTEAGSFEEPYLLTPGYNRIVLQAKDTYGRTREQVMEVIYQQATSTEQSSASSTLPVAPAQ